MIYGIENPSVGASTLYVLLDSDSTTTTLNEIKAVSTSAVATLAASNVSLVKIDDVKFSHKYIRSIGNYTFSFTLSTS